MARKAKVENNVVQVVDTSGLTSLDLVDAALCESKDAYVAKKQFRDKINQAKVDMAASYREQLKDLDAELAGMMGNIQSLESHRKLINAANESGNDEIVGLVNDDDDSVDMVTNA